MVAQANSHSILSIPQLATNTTTKPVHHSTRCPSLATTMLSRPLRVSSVVSPAMRQALVAALILKRPPWSLTEYLRRRNTHERAQRNPKSFGYLIDLLHIRAIFHFRLQSSGISACDLFPAFHSDLDFSCSALSLTLLRVLFSLCIIPCKVLASVCSSDAFCWVSTI